MKVICVSGSVGSGKTSLSKKLADKLGYKYLDVSSLIKKNKLYDDYDKKDRSYIIDIKKLNKFLIELINKGKKSLIIDSHMSHFLPKKYVDLCIITKCRIEKINQRLKKRKYSKAKIKENIECEIFDVCLDEAKQGKHKILVIDTTKRLNMTQISKLIIKSIQQEA